MGSSLPKKKEKQLFQDVQEWMNVLDRTITSLAKHIDVMQASAAAVVCQLDENITDKSDRKNEKYINAYDAAYHLLSEVKGTVADQKLYTLESVSNCLHRIWPLLKEYKATTSNLECSPLSIDTYLKNKGTATVHISPEGTENTLDFHPYHFNDAGNERKHTESKHQRSSNGNTQNTNATTTKINQKPIGQREDKQTQTSLDSENTETEEVKQRKHELKQEEIKTESNIDMLNKNILKLKKECTELRTTNEKLKKEGPILQEELSIKKRAVEEKDDQIKLLKNQAEILEENYKTLDRQLQTLKNKKVLQVQLFCQPRGGLVSTVEEDLMLQLRKKFEDDDNRLKFIQCVKTTDVKPDIPLLVVCISASRIGTDVANILQGLELTSKVSILVFHHKDVHALPNQASDRVLSGPQFENIGGIFDMAFLSNKGIYPCGMNDNSFLSILNFLDREGTLTRKC